MRWLIVIKTASVQDRDNMYLLNFNKVPENNLSLPSVKNNM